jgi:hypothetical protein
LTVKEHRHVRISLVKIILKSLDVLDESIEMRERSSGASVPALVDR